MSVFIVTYNPKRWDWTDRAKWVRRTGAGKPIRRPWSIGSRTGGITANQDRAYLLRQGPVPRGIIGSGIFRSSPYKDDHWDENRAGELANYADILWDTLLPDEDMLPLDELDAQVPGLPWRAGLQGSGVLLPAPGDDALDQLWEKHLRRSAAPIGGVPVHGGLARGQVWQNDPVRRRLVEDHAQRLLEQHFRDKKWQVKDTRRGNPFDAVATKGKQVRYLEAKGTETDGRSVLVTKGEVDWARKHAGNCVLGIVSAIRFGTDGSLDEDSGDLTVKPWDPDSGRLEPTGYAWSPPTS